MGPRGLGPKTIKLLKSLKIMKISVFFEHGKDARRNSVPKTILNNSRSSIWSHSGAKTMIGEVSINAILC